MGIEPTSEAWEDVMRRCQDNRTLLELTMDTSGRHFYRSGVLAASGSSISTFAFTLESALVWSGVGPAPAANCFMISGWLMAGAILIA